MGRRRSKRGSSSGSASKKRGSTSRRKTWKLNYDEIIPKIGREVIERLGLDYIGIDVDFISDILEVIVSEIAEARSSKPSVESLVNNIVRNKQAFYKAVAAKLASAREELTQEQLEFIVAHAPDIAGRAAPHLYRAAKRVGAESIIDSLRSLWVQYGKPTPFTCPRCGFRALTPELTCIVCGAEVSEEEVKEEARFTELLASLIEEAPSAGYEILSAGFVLYDGDRLHPPSSKPLLAGRPVIELFLTRREKELVSSLLKKKIRG